MMEGRWDSRTSRSEPGRTLGEPSPVKLSHIFPDRRFVLFPIGQPRAGPRLPQDPDRRRFSRIRQPLIALGYELLEIKLQLLLITRELPDRHIRVRQFL